MAECDACGRSENMPYECKRCGGTFCTEHRLPEAHDCPGLNAWNGGEGGGALGGGPSAGGPNAGQGPSAGGSIGRVSRTEESGAFGSLPIDTGQSGLMGYVRNNMTFVFLLAMWVTFALQWLVILNWGGDTHNAIFVASSAEPLAVWTYVTSIFAHSPVGLWHIAFNSIALYFFGPIVERKIGWKRFAVLFMGSGILAGIGSVAVPLLMGIESGGLGASGAILAVLGVLTILNPNLRVLLFFFVPMPLWVLTAGFAGFSVLALAAGGIGAGGVGHIAHLSGLLIGLAYGHHLKAHGMTAPGQLRFGGGGPGGGMGGGRRRF